MSADNSEALKLDASLERKQTAAAKRPREEGKKKKKETNSTDDYKKKFIDTRSKHWLCTWFDMTHPISADLFAGYPALKAFIYQLEKCPQTGRLHFQAFFEFHNSVSLHNIQQRLKNKNVLRYTESGVNTEEQKAITAGGWRIMRGSVQDNIDYCSKLESRVDSTAQPVQFGTFSLPVEGAAQGSDKPKRTKKNEELDKAVELINNGTATISDIWKECPLAYLYHYQNLARALAERFNKPRDRFKDPEVIIYFGPPGSGKTLKAVTDNPNVYKLHIPKAGDKLWFDGYAGQDTVLLDEFNGQIHFRQLMALIDRYEMPEQVKGGFVQLQAHRWIFTSNVAPDKWYPKYDEHMALLFPTFRRRITKCYQFIRDVEESIKQQKIVYVPTEMPTCQNVTGQDFTSKLKYVEELHQQYYDDMVRGEEFNTLMKK